MAENPNSKEYLKLWMQLDNDFINWKSTFQEITDYILPMRGKYIDTGQTAQGGEKRTSKIYDGTATRAAKMGASGIQGSLTSPARPWFRLLPPDTNMLKNSAVGLWLQNVEEIIYNIYAKTNFYQCIHSIYEDEIGFGTGVLLQEEDSEKVSRFYVMSAGEYRLATNHYGEVDTVARLFYMTARQMEQRFGRNNLSKTVIDALKNDSEKTFKVLHITKPNKNRDSNKIDSGNLPFESCYIEYDNDKNILEKKGYNENPFSCPRWSVIGNECYGVSPGHDLLSDVKMLQVKVKDLAEADHKKLDPPMTIPLSMKDTLNRLPGGLNFIDINSIESIKPLYQVQFDTVGTLESIRDLRQQIREGFYNDLFLMISQSPGIQPKNQMEIMELQEEKLIMLGPVIERQFHELLNPTIKRTVNIAWRNGIIPFPPPELSGIPIKVEYISFLAQAQKRIGTQAINSTVGFIANLAAVFPEAADKINIDEAIDAYSEMVGTPQQIIRDEKEVASIREIRQKQQQMIETQQMAEMMATGGKAMKQMAGADTEGKNALTDIAKGLAGVVGE